MEDHFFALRLLPLDLGQQQSTVNVAGPQSGRQAVAFTIDLVLLRPRQMTSRSLHCQCIYTESKLLRQTLRCAHSDVALPTLGFGKNRDIAANSTEIVATERRYFLRLAIAALTIKETFNQGDCQQKAYPSSMHT
jgi:hypothetical protein